MDAAQIAQSIANGVVFGAILALCAIGLTLVYGILNLSNFAHGDFVSLAVEPQSRSVRVGASADELDVAWMHPDIEADAHAGQSQPNAPPVSRP